MRARPVGDAGHADELELACSGYRAIAGVDEAGRGAWAGPLVAAAVILPDPIEPAARELVGLRDSKQLTARQREELAERIRRLARAVGLGIVDAATVDRIGLSAAGRQAMVSAVVALGLLPDFLLIDAFRIPGLDLPQRPIIFGDCLSVSIAAASVIAKVTRDRLLVELGGGLPHYGFERHKGYGTREHRDALARHGPCPQHRISYAPLRALIAAGA